MNYVYLALNWIFGVLALVVGLGLLTDYPFGGLAFMAIALMWLPPVRRFFYSKTNIELSAKRRSAIVVLLLIVSGYFVVEGSLEEEEERLAIAAQEAAQEATAQRQANIDYFKQNSVQILSDVRNSIQDENYDQAIRMASKYLLTNDEELVELNRKAKERKENAEREEKTAQILAKLKTIPESQYAQNRNLYQQLVANNPDNEMYKKKLDYYLAKIEEQQEKAGIEREKRQKEKAARLARFGESPTQSAWDGSYYEVERYLKRIANDPDSIEIDTCTSVYQTENGWLVGCDYRGRNAFGGMIRQSNWFTIVHGTVVEMHDASAYRP